MAPVGSDEAAGIESMTGTAGGHRWRARLVVAVLVVLVAVAATACGRDVRRGSSAGTTSVRRSSGCGEQPVITATSDPIGDVAAGSDLAGTGSRFRIGVPRSYVAADPVPLVLNLHGSGWNAQQQSLYSRLPVAGGQRGYLVVTPDAIDTTGSIDDPTRDDPVLVSVLDRVEREYCVDLDRVYAAGISLGAKAAVVTACAHPDRIAAVALVAYEAAPRGCALPVVAFHGTADGVVPFGRGSGYDVLLPSMTVRVPPAQTSMRSWAKQSGCSLRATRRSIRPDVRHWTYRGCRAGLGVEFYAIDRGGHTWPGSPVDVPYLGPVTRTIDATDIALDWFDRHRERDRRDPSG
jgi:polyhydroxybutyrate depolymerase